MNANETNPIEIIKNIFKITQSTYTLDYDRPAISEAERLEKAVSEINAICDDFLFSVKDNRNEPD